jgi:diguanylate cyclase
MAERIVVAEDDEDIRANLSRLLRLEGYEVDAAPNGRLALERVRAARPDLILSDVMMPEMTGHDLVRALRGDPATVDIPVILLTARADRQDVREGMNLGADDYLTKPFQRDEVLQSVRSRLDRVAAQAQAAQRLAAQTHHLAHHDRITDLPNRTHFMLLLRSALARPRAASQPPPVLWSIGLDNLAEMSQLLTGPRLEDSIRTFAGRIQALGDAQAALQASLQARVAEDHFTVLMDAATPLDATALEPTVERWLQALTQPFRVADEDHFPRVSLAALTLDQADTPVETVLGRAEIALSQVRQNAARRFVHHALSATADLGAHFRLHNDLHLAVEREQLRALFQPQIDAHTRELCGFEALMRWQHPQLGMVSPARFIPMAEDNGQIVAMGRWMLNAACQQAAEWNRDRRFGERPVRIAVNLSLRQFVDPAITAHVEQALATSGLAPDLLELEVTEGTAMLDLALTLRQLGRFKALGVQLALDDFGTGYSSLAYLKRFPLDVLKIDQSFVRQICHDPEDKAIAGAVASLARALDMRVIAEGVEQPEQHEVLRAMGCDEIQGYLYGKPMPAADLPPWWAAHQANWPTR